MASLPRTIVGWFLLALFRRDEKLRDEMVDLINGGEDVGWNDDESAVALAAFEIVIREFYGGGYDGHMVTEYADKVYQAMQNRDIATKLEIEAYIKRCLGEVEVQPDDISPQAKYSMVFPALNFATRGLGYGEEDFKRLIRKAERMALERGFHSPLA